MGLPPSPQVKEEVKQEADEEAAIVWGDSACASCRNDYENNKAMMNAHGVDEELCLIT